MRISYGSHECRAPPVILALSLLCEPPSCSHVPPPRPIGKTDCSRCHSATGKFCRACLLIR